MRNNSPLEASEELLLSQVGAAGFEPHGVAARSEGSFRNWSTLVEEREVARPGAVFPEASGGGSPSTRVARPVGFSYCGGLILS